MKGIARAGLVGAVVGTLGDCVHTGFGVLTYPAPVFAREAWWVPLLFFGAGIALVGSHATTRGVLREPAVGSTREVAASLAWLTGAYLCTGFFRAYTVALLVLFTATFLARMLSQPGSRTRWVHALGCAAAGPLFEFALSSTGAFAYHRNWSPIPAWLPGLYLHVALMASAVERRWPLRS